MKRSLVVLLVLSVAALSLLAATSALAAGHYNEPPMLQALVDAGKLPPIYDRLPEEPFVAGPGVLIEKENLDFEIGKYGGTLRLVHNNVGWNPDTFIMGNEPLLSAPTGNISVKGIRGNVLHSYEVSDDNQTFTFHLRKGLKWSDGVPVTMEDVLFTYEDVIMNKELTATIPAWMRSGSKRKGEPLRLDVIDDDTFRISFAEPYGGFLAQITIVGWKGYTEFIKPKHFLKQFHTRYTPLEKLEPMIQEAGLPKGEWWTLFSQKDARNWDLTRPKSLGFPNLYPWKMVETSSTLVRYERNPYYFKVDPEGNQLPYIDKLRDELTADTETSNLRVLAGEVDYLREGGSLVNLPLYKENEEKGGFQTRLYKWVSTNTLFLNHTHPDPVWRQLVRDIRFRRALNMALNRQELIDTISFGYATLPERVPSEYDPARANQLLNEVGLSKRDSEGWRLRPDGERLVIPFEISSRHPDFIPTVELVVEYWRELGVYTTMKVIDQSLRATRQRANESKAHIEANALNIWRNAGGFNHDYLPISGWGPLWDTWYRSGGEAGEEPPADVKRLYELSELFAAAVPYSPEYNAAIEEIFSLIYDNVYFLVAMEKIRKTQLLSARLGNVPHEGFSVGVNYSVEQMFFRE